MSQNLLVIGVFLLCAGCTQPDPPLVSEFVLSDSATQSKSELEGLGYSCTAKSGELYPKVYECDRDSDISTVYLYANDKAQLEGIRAFGNAENRGVWMKNATELVFDLQRFPLLNTLWSDEIPSDSSFTMGTSVIERISTGERLILRISPSAAIR